MMSNQVALVFVGAYIHQEVDKHYVELPYHNHGHADDVTLEAFALADYCEENGLVVNRLVLLLASQYHDAGFHEDFDKTLFSSKEDYSAFIASQELKSLGVDEQTIEQIESCIRSTERGVKCESLEARILRRADLANLAGSIGGLLIASHNLLVESTQLYGLHVGLIDFVRNTPTNILDYISEDVSFGDFDKKRGMSLWLRGVEKNLRLIDTVVAQPTELAVKTVTEIMEKSKNN